MPPEYPSDRLMAAAASTTSLPHSASPLYWKRLSGIAMLTPAATSPRWFMIAAPMPITSRSQPMRQLYPLTWTAAACSRAFSRSSPVGASAARAASAIAASTCSSGPRASIAMPAELATMGKTVPSGMMVRTFRRESTRSMATTR